MIFKRVLSGLALLTVCAIAGYAYLNRGLPQTIEPAEFSCLKQEDSYVLESHFETQSIYGIGLSYANHINETASSFNPDAPPPIFKKSVSSLSGDNAKVSIPNAVNLISAIDKKEPGLKATLGEQQTELLPLLDHEVELAFVLLEDISKDDLKDQSFAPRIGFLIANDLSARSIAVLGEGQENRYDYWGVSKSFDGFTPISQNIWVPNKPSMNNLPCITLTTHVNGDLRQSERSSNLIYTPTQMLRFIQQVHPTTQLRKGDLVLTGTPGGVIFSTPRWKVRLAKMLGFDRFKKLEIVQKKENAERFLKAGDHVRVSGQWLGAVSVTIGN